MATVISGDTGVSQVQNSIVSPAKLTQPLTLGTAQNTTSGTSIDFIGIPSWVKRITVMFNGVSTGGISHVMLQVGSGSLVTSGYASSMSTTGPSTAGINGTTGLLVFGGAAVVTSYGSATLNLVTGNTWIISSCTGRSDGAYTHAAGGGIALSGTLDRLRITTVNGTDTFDAGSVNILYEG